MKKIFNKKNVWFSNQNIIFSVITLIRSITKTMNMAKTTPIAMAMTILMAMTTKMANYHDHRHNHDFLVTLFLLRGAKSHIPIDKCFF